MFDSRKSMVMARAALVVAVAAAMTWTTGTQAGMLTFSDSVWNDSDWTSEWVGGEPPGFNGTTGEQVLTGGAIDNGPYRQTSFSIEPEFLFQSAKLTHFKAGAVFDPSTQGEIIDLTGGFRHREFTTNNDQDSSVAFAISQDGNIYTSIFLGYNQGSTSWAGTSFTLTPSNFHKVSGSGPAAPDFTGSGSTIQFGYFTEFTYVDANVVETVGLDEWEVTVNFSDAEAVPEPSSIVLFTLGVGIAGIGLFFRRFSNSQANAA